MNPVYVLRWFNKGVADNTYFGEDGRCKRLQKEARRFPSASKARAGAEDWSYFGYAGTEDKCGWKPVRLVKRPK